MQRPTFSQFVRYLATFCSLSGALLVAVPSEVLRALGFSLWISANCFWLWDARKRVDLAQQGMWAWYICSSSAGLFWILWGWIKGF